MDKQLLLNFLGLAIILVPKIFKFSILVIEKNFEQYYHLNFYSINVFCPYNQITLYDNMMLIL